MTLRWAFAEIYPDFVWCLMGLVPMGMIIDDAITGTFMTGLFLGIGIWVTLVLTEPKVMKLLVGEENTMPGSAYSVGGS